MSRSDKRVRCRGKRSGFYIANCGNAYLLANSAVGGVAPFKSSKTIYSEMHLNPRSRAPVLTGSEVLAPILISERGER